MCVGDTITHPTGAPYPRCASGFSTRSVTPGAMRLLIACWRQTASNPLRIASVPMTVIGDRPSTGKIPVASPVETIGDAMFSGGAITGLLAVERQDAPIRERRR